ncbi:MAG: Type II secretion system protein F [candidate division BRC1 bacterium ADurb.Bin183]|nr:MAG: Type II secretion system protein F [candidate division BRC1 bacterium ADurb.Bin183]
MAVFQYMARDAQGKMVNGTTQAASQSAVVKMLRDQGLTPTSIQAGAAAGKGKQARGKGGGPKLDDAVIISRQMATMIRAGLPLIEVLDILADQAEKASLKKIMRDIEKDVEAGSSFTEAIQKHPKLFDTFFLSMVRAGEASGMLDAILDQVATYLEKVLAIRRKVKSAVMYPLTVSVIAFAITIFLLVKVVPVFEDIFSELGSNLPVPTQITIYLSKTLQNHLLKMLIGLVVVIFIIGRWAKSKSGRYKLDYLKLNIPIFGPIFIKVAIAKFTRTLGTLIKAGVNILYALEITAKTAGNTVIEEAVLKTRTSIQSGESLTRPLIEAGCFPPMVTRMIDVGERTGMLETMLSKIADFYEDQVNAAVTGLTSLIEPLLIVFLGVVVGFIVISMFMPMFKMVEVLTKS